MPIVTIQVTQEGSGPGRSSVTADEKAKLIGASEPQRARCYYAYNGSLWAYSQR
jgi:hypothetical protein